MNDPPNLLRARTDHTQARVTYVELFFDLVFVFAVTQISHMLLAHLDLWGALEALLLMMAVWWVWIYTSWVTNWLDPERTAVRVLLFALMLAGLILSASIPKAFAERGVTFAGAYVAMQLGRTAFMLWAVRPHSPTNYRNFQRITCWMALSAVFWIVGAFVDGHGRMLVWAIALGIEYVSPAFGFWTPRLGRSTTADWDIEGAHLAERCGLFIIIALGESILVTGATFAELTWSRDIVTAFVMAFVGSVAMWWIYFNIGAERASDRISRSADPGRLGRIAYTYIHLLLVAGIIVCAVADELTLKHPHEAGNAVASAVLIGGPSLYVLGNLLFKRVTAGWFPLSHLVGLALLAALAFAAPGLSALTLGLATSLVLVVIAVWETISLGSGV